MQNVCAWLDDKRIKNTKSKYSVLQKYQIELCIELSKSRVLHEHTPTVLSRQRGYPPMNLVLWLESARFTVQALLSCIVVNSAVSQLFFHSNVCQRRGGMAKMDSLAHSLSHPLLYFIPSMATGC